MQHIFPGFLRVSWFPVGCATAADILRLVSECSRADNKASLSH